MGGCGGGVGGAVGVDESGGYELTCGVHCLVNSTLVTLPDVDDPLLVEYNDSVQDYSVILSVEADHGSTLDLNCHVGFLWWVIVLRG